MYISCKNLNNEFRMSVKSLVLHTGYVMYYFTKEIYILQKSKQ